MKKIIFLSLLFFCLKLSAQDEKRERIRAHKVAFITSEVQLTPEESAKFWPIYHEYEARQRQIKRNGYQKYKENNARLHELSEKEASAALQQMESAEEESLSLKKRYNANLRNILPAVKILKLKKAEDDFNRKLLKQYREKSKKD